MYNERVWLEAGTEVTAMVISCGRFLPVNGDGKGNASLKLQCCFEICCPNTFGSKQRCKQKYGLEYGVETKSEEENSACLFIFIVELIETRCCFCE